MKNKLFILRCLPFAALLFNCYSCLKEKEDTGTAQKVIFLHHSIGKNLYYEGAVASWIDSYNKTNHTSIMISERSYPIDPWTLNYPYDYWKLWVDGSCNSDNPNIECLNTLAEKYDLVIWKHCAPGSSIDADTGTPDIRSDERRLENYKEQYRALRTLFDSYPETKFMVWTLAPLHRLVTSAAKAQRANEFVQWVKSGWLTEDGKPHPNIVVFDFFSLVAELNENPENGVRYCLKFDYERSHIKDESHPTTEANKMVGPIFAEAIVKALAEN
jgi:hypothetical protein